MTGKKNARNIDGSIEDNERQVPTSTHRHINAIGPVLVRIFLCGHQVHILARPNRSFKNVASH